MIEQKEIFRTIPNYTKYKVSNKGNVLSLKNNIILKPAKNSKGYLGVNLFNKSGRKHHTIHQLVAIAFLNHQPCGMKRVVDHIDENKENNSLDNLQIISNSENLSKSRKSLSKHKGVRFYASRNKWTANINNKYIGIYNSELEAVNAIKLYNSVFKV